MSGIAKKFGSLYPGNPYLYKVPGRINLIGEHTDYNGGFVLPGATNLCLEFAVSPSSSDRYQFYSMYFEEEDSCTSEGLGFKKKWTIYFQNLIRLLLSKGYPISPVQCVIGGALPVGAGMSSSSALTCGLLFALNDCFELGLTKMEMTYLASGAEKGAGLQGGMMDQFVIFHGQKSHLTLLNCLKMTYDLIPCELNDYEIVLFDTKIQHNLIDSDYNSRREECQRAFEIIKNQFPEIDSIHKLSLKCIDQCADSLGNKLWKRIRFLFLENRRVQKVRGALQSKDLDSLGQYLYQSHEGLANQFEVSCEELDFIVNWTKDKREIKGSRMMGGGFGGTTIQIIYSHAIEDLFDQLKSEYSKAFGLYPDYHVIQLDDGIQKLF